MRRVQSVQRLFPITQRSRGADNSGVELLLQVVCLIVGHRWERGVQTFGHTLWHCDRCGRRRYA